MVLVRRTLRRSVLPVAVVAMLGVSCGGVEPDAPSEENGESVSEGPVTTVENEGAGPDDARPSFPDEPAASQDFRQGAGAWDLPAPTTEEGLALRPRGEPQLVPAPLSVEPAGRGTLVELTFGTVVGRGRYGAYCRGDVDSRYEATLSTEGRLSMQRVEGGLSRELSGDDVPGYPRPGLAIVRLACVEVGDTVTFAVTLDALGTFQITDPDPLPVPPGGGTGVIADGDLEVTVEGATVWLAE